MRQLNGAVLARGAISYHGRRSRGTLYTGITRAPPARSHSLMARIIRKLTEPRGRQPQAYEQGKLDCQRGHTANPFGHPVDRDNWERGHAAAFADGLGDKPSFKHSGRKRRVTQST